MDQKDVKRRDVVNFDEFVKAYDKVKKAIPLKQGEKPHYGIHDIKGEDLYVKNDANPYKAMGIPHDEKKADVNQMNHTTNQVDVYDGKAEGKDDGKSDKGKDKATDPKQDAKEKKDFKDVVKIVNKLSLREGEEVALDEAAAFDKKNLEKTMKKDEKEVDEKLFNFGKKKENPEDSFGGPKYDGPKEDDTFKNLGYDEEGHLIGNCKECGVNGVLAIEHRKEHPKA